MLRSFLPIILLLVFSFAKAQTSTTILFDFDKYELTSSARQILDALPKSSIASISIYGHCDQIGSEAYNDWLSEKRANAVKEYLVSMGVETSKISLIKGLGESQPIVDKLDADSRRMNRRVTVEFVTNVSAPGAPKNNRNDIVATIPKRIAKEKLVDEIKDTATKAGDNIILQNINFYGGRHAFLPQAYPALNELLETMQAIPTLEIEIQGHICCTEGPQDGLDNDTGQPFLSFNRARAVFDFLVRNGIARNRMTFRGFGHRYPIIEIERTEEEKTINRRVEIKIVKK